ncbi:hypothetical protein B0J12DRAFT_213947 [Macrophomina phaseolina]|uniref:Short-chain dehydrogenase/reductase SDR n=1 Tax=Macrophomina phaseolina TaxID=35725 RepID=A0ABQ8G1H6_9PEZI|nr:hypothetical protein B0J12DRAFT_213947 [Macrophomina phaseolina]
MASRSDFGHNTKASEVAAAFAGQIKGRVIAVTGIAKAGLGSATALAFAQGEPSLLILISRTQTKLDEVAAEIAAIKPNVNVKTVQVDLLSHDSVRRAADAIKALTPRIDVLVNNAALTLYERKHSSDGIEYQLAANHLGPFLLTNLLQDRFLEAAKTAPAGATRIVNVSSEAHRVSPFRFHDWNCEQKPVPEDETDSLENWPAVFRKSNDGYNGFVAYGQSKTANILFSVGLNKRLAEKGVVSYSLHPGAIATELGREMTGELKDALADLLKRANQKPSNEEGSSTTLVAALDPALNDIKGVYLDDCQLAKPEPYAVDLEKAEKLWALSEELVKQKF